ncbi:hypothetical protein GOBAR_DD15446 [Gossypium barbadense]|nr:hypothetical protein GOBAR_DD15446 [Gossypium barbadense]
MALGVEVAEMVWDLSLRAQSRRAAAMNSVWIKEEGEGKLKGDGKDQALIDKEHDLEDGVLIGEEWKKRVREKMESAIVLGNENSPAAFNKRDFKSMIGLVAAEAYDGFHAVKLGISMGIH